MRNITYTHDYFMCDINRIMNWCKNIEYTPDIIVGFARGGLVPGVYLSHRLNAPFKPIQLATRDHVDFNMKDIYKIVNDLVEKYDKILVIEDIIDTGRTLELFTQPIRPDDVNKFKFISLWWNSSQLFQVDFRCNVFDSNIEEVWVKFPWEI